MEKNKNKQASKPHKSKFIERWAKAEDVSIKLGWALVLMSVVSICLVTALIKVATKDKPIYYVPGASSAGIAHPNEIPESSIWGFTSNWLVSLLNFTPATYKDVRTNSERYMSPKYLSKFRSVKDDIQSIERGLISSSFMLTEDPKVTKKNRFYEIGLVGKKQLFIGKEIVKEETVQYYIYLTEVSPNDENIYGLQVDNLIYEILEEKINK